MDMIKIAKAILGVNEAIGKERIRLEPLGKEWAKAESDYDRALAVAIICLQNGEEYEIDGHKICNPPVSTTEKIAKGICSDKKLAFTVAERKYKAVNSNLKSMQSQLTGFQSVNKYLDEV